MKYNLADTKFNIGIEVINTKTAALILRVPMKIHSKLAAILPATFIPAKNPLDTPHDLAIDIPIGKAITVAPDHKIMAKLTSLNVFFNIEAMILVMK